MIFFEGVQFVFDGFIVVLEGVTGALEGVIGALEGPQIDTEGVTGFGSGYIVENECANCDNGKDYSAWKEGSVDDNYCCCSCCGYVFDVTKLGSQFSHFETTRSSVALSWAGVGPCLDAFLSGSRDYRSGNCSS